MKPVAIVAASFNQSIVENLVTSAQQALAEHEFAASLTKLFWVPGAYELPFFVKQAILTEQFQAIIALGSIIKGETPHFDYVASCCLHGLSQLSIEHNIPVACGVLTTDSKEQAIIRSQGDKKNRGREAAIAVIELLQELKKLT